jgi:hypothetical protein
VLRLAAPPLGALLLAGPGIASVLLIDIVSYLRLSHRARGLHVSSDRAPMSFPRRVGLYA